jgi:hypothetical protein
MEPSQKVEYSALAIMSVHAITVLLNLTLSILKGSGGGLATFGGPGDWDFFDGGWGILFFLFSAAFGCFVIFCANKMRTLSSYTLGFLACVLSIIPCYYNCCFLGIPVGVWGLFVLMDPAVKHAFKQKI